jgi:hypothetical protein
VTKWYCRNIRLQGLVKSVAPASITACCLYEEWGWTNHKNDWLHGDGSVSGRDGTSSALSATAPRPYVDPTQTLTQHVSRVLFVEVKQSENEPAAVFLLVA